MVDIMVADTTAAVIMVVGITVAAITAAEIGMATTATATTPTVAIFGTAGGTVTA